MFRHPSKYKLKVINLMRMKYKCRPYVKKIVNPFVLLPKSNASQNTLLIGRVTKILLTSKIPNKKENKLPPNSKFQRLTHWFQLDSVCDILHLLTVKKFVFHYAAKFLRTNVLDI